MSGNRYNWLIAGIIAVGSIAILFFLRALSYAAWGEAAGAVGGVLGGIVGAGGAVWTVFLLIDRQRQEEAKRVTDAVRMEIIGFCKFLVAALECCQSIKTGQVTVPTADARSVMIPLDPIVYKSVADRVGLLPFPHQVIAFHIRLVEAQAAIQMLIDSSRNVPLGTSISSENAATLADTLVTALQLAEAIISYVPGPSLDVQVSDIELQNLTAALRTAKDIFPELEAWR